MMVTDGIMSDMRSRDRSTKVYDKITTNECTYMKPLHPLNIALAVQVQQSYCDIRDLTGLRLTVCFGL